LSVVTKIINNNQREYIMVLPRYIFTAYMVTTRAHHRIVGEKNVGKLKSPKVPEKSGF
tara:strand:- start:313 stop:486 length:174 start_codon:yes stop_codon:yes gene_type:complete